MKEQFSPFFEEMEKSKSGSAQKPHERTSKKGLKYKAGKGEIKEKRQRLEKLKSDIDDSKQILRMLKEDKVSFERVLRNVGKYSREELQEYANAVIYDSNPAEDAIMRIKKSPSKTRKGLKKLIKRQEKYIQEEEKNLMELKDQ